MALVACAKHQDVFVSLTYHDGRHSCRNLSPKDYGGGAIHKGREATDYPLLSHTVDYQLITTPKYPLYTASTFAIMDSTRVTLDELDQFTNPDRFVGKLNGKVAVVTGTSAGIGRSIAKAFAAAGAQVACIARRQADLDSLITEIESTGGRAFAIAADVAQPGAATKIVAEVEQKFGPVDILINNAGISRISPLVSEDPSIDIWWRIYEVNVRAPVALIRAVLPSMIERGSGVVMTTSSQVASMALPVMTAYASSKAAISKFHESIVPELEGTGVFSYAINPGMVATELGKPEHAINKEAINHPAMQAFIGSVGGARKLQKPESCANMMLTLAADERCKVLNGRHLNADQKMEPVLLEAEKEGKGRLGKEKLYLVNIGEL